MPSLSTLFSSSPKKRPESSAQKAPRRPSSANGPKSSSSSNTASRQRPPYPSISSHQSYNKYPDLNKKRPSRHNSAYEEVHPLNLPPAERERRRSAMSTGSAGPPSPVEAPYSDPNGTVEHPQTNDEKIPTPPPHKSSPPPSQPSLNPEEYKVLGNKYFKARDYPKAIDEYSKGEHLAITPH